MLEIVQYIYIGATLCKSVAAAFSMYDYAKFGFYVSDKIGIVDIIAQKIKKKYRNTPNALLEIIGTEKSNLGDFQIINFFS
jgi:hypothetical protein